jgi:hypothetical protein
MSDDINIDIVPVPDAPVGGTDPASTTPSAGTTKPRSGFARQKLKLARLSDLYSNLLTITRSYF